MKTISKLCFGIMLSLNVFGENAPCACGIWNFDDYTAPYKDSSGSGNDGEGNARWCVNGIKGGGMRFNGTSNYMQVRIPAANRPENGITVSFWFKADKDSKITAALRHTNIHFYINLDKYSGWYGVKTVKKQLDDGFRKNMIFYPEKWYHVAFTYDKNEMVLYLNGKKIKSRKIKNGSKLRYNNGIVNIGGRQYRSNGGYKGFFKGIMDEIKILPYAQKEYPEVLRLIELERIKLISKKLKYLRNKYSQGIPASLLAEQTNWEKELKKNIKSPHLLFERGQQLYWKVKMALLYGRDSLHYKFAVAIEVPYQRIINDPVEYSPRKISRRIIVKTAANERESCQLLLLPYEGKLENIKFELPTTLKSDPNQNKEAEFKISVKKVLYSPLGSNSPFVEIMRNAPDLLVSQKEFTVTAKNPTPVWLEVYTPPKTMPGTYRGKIIIQNGSSVKAAPSLDLFVKVWDFELPQKSSCPSVFGIWERDIQTYVKRGDGEKFIGLLEKYCDILLEHRLTPSIMTQPELVASWLRKQFYPNYHVKTDGQVHANYKYFDRLVEHCMKKGMNDIVIGPAYHKYRNFKDVIAKISESKPDPIWKNVSGHIDEKGWLKQAVAYPFDEVGKALNIADYLCRKIRRNAPGLRILVTGGSYNYPVSELKDIDIWVPQLHWINFPRKDKEQYAGKQVWTYVCTGPNFPMPNFHIDSPFLAARMFPMMSYRFRFDGLLYWAVNFHTAKNHPVSWKNPYHPGEGTIVYADENGKPIPTIRLKSLADGMEDWEYLEILKKLDQQKWSQAMKVLNKLIPAQNLQLKTYITVTEPREASYKTRILESALIDLFSYPQKWAQYRNALAEMIEKSKKRKNNE